MRATLMVSSTATSSPRTSYPAPPGEVEHVYLTDFGIAKSSAALTRLTGTGVFVGTVEYMAPEQMEGREVSPQTDVYSLGATFYQCLTGRLPFQRELVEGVRPPVGTSSPSPPSGRSASRARRGARQGPRAIPPTVTEL